MMILFVKTSSTDDFFKFAKLPTPDFEWGRLLSQFFYFSFGISFIPEFSDQTKSLKTTFKNGTLPVAIQLVTSQNKFFVFENLKK